MLNEYTKLGFEKFTKEHKAHITVRSETLNGMVKRI